MINQGSPPTFREKQGQKGKTMSKKKKVKTRIIRKTLRILNNGDTISGSFENVPPYELIAALEEYVSLSLRKNASIEYLGHN